MPDQNDEYIKRLRQQYQELASVAGSLAHEIKNPLSVIRMNIELLGEDFLEVDSPEARKALKPGIRPKSPWRLVPPAADAGASPYRPPIGKGR